MPDRPLDILEFITHPQLLNDHILSVAQRACLKAIYGLPLDAQECEVYERATGRPEYVAVEQSEATIIVGRRGGKTSKLASPIACYEALRDHRLGRGERGYVVLIAPVKYQAQIAFRYIHAYLNCSPALQKLIEKERHGEIDLKNGITIACYPCSYVTVRGVPVVCAICDELAFWRHEETAANPEEEVLDALRPAMATFPKAKLIKISTPYRKEGILWREFQQRKELDHLVWRLPSPDMNPALDPGVLERARKQNEEKFRREFLAEFTENVVGWIDLEVLEPCIMRGRSELPRVGNATYVAAIDPAFVRNDFALAILHRTGNNPLVVDRVARWAGTKKAPLGYEWVCEEIVHVLKQYGIGTVLGDQYCAPIIQQHFRKLGITFKEFTFGLRTRLDLFSNLKHLLVQRKIELLEEPELLCQLRALEERKAPSGNLDIRPAYGQKDDLAVAVALGAFELSSRGGSCEYEPRVFVYETSGPALYQPRRGGPLGRSGWGSS